MITDLLDQIDRLDQETTQGPWQNDGYEVLGAPYKFREMLLAPHVANADQNECDTEFIALARTALPALSRAVRAVLELHEPVDDYIHLRTKICSHRYCVDEALDQLEYPCPTVQAITDAMEGIDDAA